MFPPYLQNALHSRVLTQGILQLLLLSTRRLAVYIIGLSAPVYNRSKDIISQT